MVREAGSRSGGRRHQRCRSALRWARAGGAGRSTSGIWLQTDAGRAGEREAVSDEVCPPGQVLVQLCEGDLELRLGLLDSLGLGGDVAGRDGNICACLCGRRGLLGARAATTLL